MATFSTLAELFQSYGVMDFLLPFLLVFTIVFAIMQKTKILGDNRNFNVVIALVLALIFVVPHIVGTYPLGYDPVDVMNEALPSISLVAIAAIMVLILMGMFGTNFANAAAPIIGVVSLGFVVFIFGAALGLWQGPYDIFGWWSEEVTELMIVIAVFGLVVWFIVRDPEKPSNSGEAMLKQIGKMFEKNN